MDEKLNDFTARPFQFTLGQLLLGVTLFACVLSGGRWLYLRYVYVTPLTADRDNLSDYFGRKVAFAGKYEKRWEARIRLLWE